MRLADYSYTVIVNGKHQDAMNTATKLVDLPIGSVILVLRQSELQYHIAKAQDDLYFAKYTDYLGDGTFHCTSDWVKKTLTGL